MKPKSISTANIQTGIEPLLTIKQAAKVLGIEYRQLLRGVEAGQIPFYQIGKSRRMVRVSEILSSICSNHKLKED